MSGLLSLSPELLEKTLLHLDDLTDVVHLSATCSRLHNFVHQAPDDHLWRSLFLQRYDDPRPRLTASGDWNNDWKERLKERTAAGKVLCNFKSVSSTHKAPLDLYLSLLEDSPPGLEMTGRNSALLYDLISKPGSEALYGLHTRSWLRCEEDRASLCQATQSFARLSTHVGLGDILRLELGVKERAQIRGRCYDLRLWTEDILYGPFFEDGSIDWEKMEVVMLTSCANALDLVRALGVTDRVRLPCRLSAARPYSAPDWDDQSVERDWAGVTGVWRRCISFLDWNDLQRYQIAASSGLGATYFERFAGSDGFTGEAVRIITASLKVTGYKPGPLAHRPTILFEGVNWFRSPQEARTRGQVMMRANGDIVWQLMSRFGGQDRWSSIGAQVGGERSAFGLVGLWAGSLHAFDMGDPAGPFWMWKVFGPLAVARMIYHQPDHDRTEDEPDPHELAEEEEEGQDD